MASTLVIKQGLQGLLWPLDLVLPARQNRARDWRFRGAQILAIP